jgi:hypothetical protein
MRASHHDLPETVAFEDPGGLRSNEQVISMGEMQGAFRFYPKGIDVTGPFKGLAHDKCPAPHWGYVITGRIRVAYVDHEEMCSTGDLFYWPPYHMIYFDEDTRLLEFTPVQAFRDFEALVEARTAAST